MKILVTGVAGFIGSHLCEKLVQLGHQVTGLDCYTDYYDVSLKRKNSEEVQKSGVTIEEIDLTEDDLTTVVRDFDVIYHLAAQPGISSQVPLSTYIRNNIVATHNLLEVSLALKNLKLFVNISTSSVYGAYATSGEDAPPAPTSYYGVTKLAGEQLALAYCRQGRLPVSSLRLFSVYGPRERPEKLYTKLILALMRNEEIPIYAGSEEHLRSYTYVGDAVAGMTAVLDHKEACVGEIFNIGNDQEISTARGIKIVEEMMGKKVLKKTLPPREGDQLQTRACIDKARRILDYNPQTSPEVGLKHQVEWLKAQTYDK